MSTGNSQLKEVGAINAHLVVVAGKQLITDGVQTFEAFDKRANDIDHALRVLGSSMQLLGSSVGVLHATYQLRKALMRLQFHLRENAAWLYDESVKPNEIRDVRSVKPHMKINGQIYVPNANPDKSQKQPETILHGMERLVKNIRTFIERINEISEFQDELLNKSFLSFADELEYRASTLGRYRAQLNTRSFKERVNKLAEGFSQRLDKMHEALQNFQSTGIPTIQRSQEHKGHGLQALSAVATFFSGVTASTIQYRVEATTSTLQNAVNGLWIMSLACSIASAVSAQVVYHWRTSRFSSPSKYAPVAITHMLKHLPLVYLCCSVSTFMIGLSVFTFSSDQHLAISIVIAIFTGIVSFQLVYFVAWFGLERMAYSHTKGQRWFLQILSDLPKEFQEYSAKSTSMVIKKIKGHSRRQSNMPVEKDKEVGQITMIDTQSNRTVGSAKNLGKKVLSPRMRSLVERIMQHYREEKMQKLKEQYPLLSSRRSSTYMSYADKQAINLQLFAVVEKHHGLIKHLAFSPNGEFLATCGWDGTAMISNVDEAISLRHILRHTQPSSSSLELSYFGTLGKRANEELVRGVGWSPDNKRLATRTKKTVRIWDVVDGSHLKTISCAHNLEAMAWSSNGDYIILIEHVLGGGQEMTVEYTTVTRYRVAGNDSQDNMPLTKTIERVKVISIALADDSTLIAAGTDTAGGKAADAEKLLISFNFISGEIMSTAPISGEVRGIDITRPQKNICSVLLTFKRENAYPELWKINMRSKRQEFQWVRSYFAKASCDFSGRGCFGGAGDSYVCCSSQEGEIFIWNRDTGLLLHAIRPANDEHIKFFACNKRASPEFLCAAGAVDGVLSVWGTRNEPTTAGPSSPQYYFDEHTTTPKQMSQFPQSASRQSSLIPT